MYGISINDHLMKGTEDYKLGLIDTGTTFTYLPATLY